MNNSTQIFTEKTKSVLNRNLKMQELLSEAAMRVDWAQDYQTSLLSYLKNSDTLTASELEEFCESNIESPDQIIEEQSLIMDCIKDLISAVDSYAIKAFLKQNLLNQTNISKITLNDMKKNSLLGKRLPSEEYYDHNQTNNTKGN